jgi:hypothetical protein
VKQRLLIGGIGAILAALWVASADVAAQAQAAAGRQGESNVQTPRRANGVPDFSGIWVPTQRRGEVPDAFDPKTGNYRTNSDNTRTGNPVDFERDPGIRMRMFARENKPWYKPEYWERVMFNDVHGHSQLAPDPTFQCMPAGVPRIGLPQEILQNDRQMVFLYPLHQRRIYIDGRAHPPEEQWIGTWFGHSVGRWEGDTLVISTVDFNGLEWLGWPGWFTTPDKQVTERIRRAGNTLTWEAEVTDSVLMRPWKPNPQTRQLNTDPVAELEEPLPCVERDLQHMVTRERG